MASAPLSHRLTALLGAVVGLLTAGATARAQQVELVPIIPTQPPPAIESEPILAPELAPRPRMSLAVGMGASFDASGFPNGTHAIPAFIGTGGIGEGLAGFELGAFATSASGRYPATGGYAPMDRLALDAYGVLRPAARVRPEETRYGYLVLRTVAVELGLGYERDGHTNGAGSRWQVHTGARVDLPLTPGERSELRLRLGYRRALGLYTPVVKGVEVGDSNDVYASLVAVF